VIIRFKKSLVLSEFKLFEAADVVAEDVVPLVLELLVLTVLMTFPFVGTRFVVSSK
jgi:hypothetical protein